MSLLWINMTTKEGYILEKFSLIPITYDGDDPISPHARCRMMEHGISAEILFLVLQLGRIVRTRGAVIYVVGKKEVKECFLHGIDLRDCEGVHVVMERDDVVRTVYRNRSLDGVRKRRRISRRRDRALRKSPSISPVQ